MSGNIPVKSVLNVLGGHSGLRSLAARCDYLDKLAALVAAHMPPELRARCHVANVSEGVLILCAESAAWTTRLRFHAPTLLAALRVQPEFTALHEIRVRVATPQAAPRTPPATPAPQLPAAAADHLRAAAACIEAPALRAALLRLAARGRSGGS
jgi:hypothetical protein